MRINNIIIGFEIIQLILSMIKHLSHTSYFSGLPTDHNAAIHVAHLDPAVGMGVTYFFRIVSVELRVRVPFSLNVRHTSSLTAIFTHIIIRM